MKVEKDCELADFIQQKQLIFQIGDADKEVILMKKDTENVQFFNMHACAFNSSGRFCSYITVTGYSRILYW